jgi:ribosomal protein S18 acetylase RimI-like enzyme
MQLRSLGYRTDLIFAAFDGQIIDRGDYLVIRSPLNPTFYWGNFLLFASPPAEGDFHRWRELFLHEVGASPEVKHIAFGWDSPQGEAGLTEPFVQAGFDVNRDVVLTTPRPRPPARPSSAIIVRPLASADDWAQVLDLQVSTREPAHEETGYRVYKERAHNRYRRMETAGLGHWYGAFIDNRLVADLGIFHDGKGLARYQAVETHPDFRRRGIAGTLVYQAGIHLMAEHELHTLVIIAEDGAAPSRLYQALGFTPTEKTVGMQWWEGKPTKTREA